MPRSRIAALESTLRWQSPIAHRIERVYFERLSFWRDFFPGAPFVLTFSERWFPPKVIALWPMLRPFERLGLVLDYFRRSGGCTAFGTETARGWPRPEDDKYVGQLADADPLYAAWGTTA